MTPAHREQLEALLDRFEEHYTEAVGKSRGLAPAAVRALVDEGITSAARAKEAGLLDRVAYEDEIVGPRHRPLAEARRFLGARVPRLGGGRVAVVSLTGGIVPGKSRRLPAPVGGKTAGAEPWCAPSAPPEPTRARARWCSSSTRAEGRRWPAISSAARCASSATRSPSWP